MWFGTLSLTVVRKRLAEQSRRCSLLPPLALEQRRSGGERNNESTLEYYSYRCFLLCHRREEPNALLLLDEKTNSKFPKLLVNSFEVYSSCTQLYALLSEYKDMTYGISHLEMVALLEHQTTLGQRPGGKSTLHRDIQRPRNA